MQCCVSPRAALVQPSSWHRLPPPCAAYTRLRAALLLTLPPAHGTPPGSLNVCAAETSLRRVIHSRHPHPLSALDDPLVHIKPKTVAVREQVRRWVQHVSVNVVNSAWAGDVRWVCSWEGWTGTPPQPPPPGSQALPVVPLLQTEKFEHTTRCTVSTARRRDTLECTWCYKGPATTGRGCSGQETGPLLRRDDAPVGLRECSWERCQPAKRCSPAAHRTAPPLRTAAAGRAS
jgi:hypothetical protein